MVQRQKKADLNRLAAKIKRARDACVLAIKYNREALEARTRAFDALCAAQEEFDDAARRAMGPAVGAPGDRK